jgi:hypothetical protein
VFSNNVRKVAPGSVDLRPHFVSRRLADLLAGLLWLSRDFPHPDVLSCVAQLAGEAEALLGRLAAAVSAPRPADLPRARRVFLLANLDLVASLLRDRELAAAPEAARFEVFFTDFVFV